MAISLHESLHTNPLSAKFFKGRNVTPKMYWRFGVSLPGRDTLPGVSFERHISHKFHQWTFSGHREGAGSQWCCVCQYSISRVLEQGVPFHTVTRTLQCKRIRKLSDSGKDGRINLRFTNTLVPNPYRIFELLVYLSNNGKHFFKSIGKEIRVDVTHPKKTRYLCWR